MDSSSLYDDSRLPPSMIDVPGKRRRPGQMFLRSNIVLRIMGLMLGFVALLPSLLRAQLPDWTWAVILAHGLLWPLLGAWRLTRASNILRTEATHLKFDHLLCGVWAGAIGLNPLPSIVTYAFMAMVTTMLGGVRLAGVCTLLHAAGAVLGLIVFGWRYTPHVSMQDVLACTPVLVAYPLTVGALSHMTLQALARQRRQLRELIGRDPLSSLHNRRVWDAHVAQTWAARGRSTCSLVLADIDHFKQVNDRWGHAAGDEAIRRFARHLREALRTSDLVCRYGGEEFAILMPRSGEQEAHQAMERVRALLRSEPIVDGQLVTASFGVAELDARLPQAQAWIERADRMLYAAKRRGRDRIELASNPENRAMTDLAWQPTAPGSHEALVLGEPYADEPPGRPGSPAHREGGPAGEPSRMAA